jgi:hypothetical protein
MLAVLRTGFTVTRHLEDNNRFRWQHTIRENACQLSLSIAQIIRNAKANRGGRIAVPFGLYGWREEMPAAPALNEVTAHPSQDGLGARCFGFFVLEGTGSQRCP